MSKLRVLFQKSVFYGEIDEDCVFKDTLTNKADITELYNKDIRNIKDINYFADFDLIRCSVSNAEYIKALNPAVQLKGLFGPQPFMECHATLTLLKDLYLNYTSTLFSPTSTLFYTLNNLLSHNGIRYFVRPNESTKNFEIFDVTPSDIKILDQVLRNNKVYESDSVLSKITNAAPILQEYRFGILNNKLVLKTCYSSIEKEIPESAIDICKLAMNVLNKNNIHTYVLDVAELSNGICKVLELNSLSCSGYYSADPSELLSELSNNKQ